MCVCLPQPQVLYQMSGSFRVLHSILAVPRIALSWTETSVIVHRICWSHSPSLGVTARNALITTGTLNFTFQLFFQILVLLNLFMLLLHDVTVIWNCLPITTAVFCFLQQLLVCVKSIVPQDLWYAILNLFWLCLPLGF